MADAYYRPLVQRDKCKPRGALPVAGGHLWFTHVEQIARGSVSEVVAAADIPTQVRENLISARARFCGIDMQRPSIMGILNATPDSFSDGGQHYTFKDAVNGAHAMIDAGADLIDIGGESTRPGADFVDAVEEARRTSPVIAALNEAGTQTPLSIDTRKASVAKAAFDAGAVLFNDVTALTYDAESLATAADLNASVCIMHAAGDPKTMQDKPEYENVLLDVFDYLEARILACEEAGIPRAKIMIDVGIGFGKTQEHNLKLLRGIALFHGLGCPILLGASRKRFIGTIGNAPDAADRVAGSIAVGLNALNQGVQMLRVHDIAETKQAIALNTALSI
ncbi:dihydropteroate synthase [Rhodobacterales bacterium 52_120_T64]|nr:dihydropteroate synthase [Rhodobacterales bacterium 52_120_T64]